MTYSQAEPAVDDAGRLAISAFALARGRIDELLLLSPPHELPFGAPIRVTTASPDPHSPTATGQKHGAWREGSTVELGARGLRLFWRDPRGGLS